MLKCEASHSICSFLFSGASEDETDFGLDDIIPAVSRVTKGGRKKKNDIEMEKLKKKTSVKAVRYPGLDANQVFRRLPQVLEREYMLRGVQNNLGFGICSCLFQMAS